MTLHSEIPVNSPLMTLSSEDWDCAQRSLGMRITTFKKDEVLLTCTADTATLGILLAGTAHDTRCYASGERTLVDILHPGDIFGDGWQAPLINCYEGPLERSAVATSEVSALIFSPNTLHDEAVACPTQTIMRHVVWKAMLVKQERLRTKIEVLSQSSLRERITAFLLREALNGQRNQFMISMSRQELAEYLHANRAALSRELSHMRDDGLIDYVQNAFDVRNLAPMNQRS